jgi:DNA-binding response OmpR family regulator
MKKKIYITDDDPGVQDIFRIIFESAGYVPTIFQNGKDLLDNLNNEYPDMYILDKQLSGMDGLDLCRNLKNGRKTRNIPVLIVSATPGLRNMAKAAGADDFIEKPFKKNELLKKVASYL